MSFSRPTLQALIDRSVSDINTRLPGVDAALRRSNLNVLALTHAGAVHGLYGFIQWLSNQIIYDTADTDYLERWASIWGINRLAAGYASGSVTVTGISGSTVPAGSLFTRADGAEFEVDADVTLSSGTGTVSVTAVVAGQSGNTSANTTFSISTPISGIDSTATVATGGLVNGADVESDDALRARLLSRIQLPPHGGADHDYIAWALEVPGVTRAWVYAQENGLGTVTVRFVRDNDASIIPDAGEVATVQAYIEDRRPVTADVTVVAPVASPLNLTISVTPNTTTVKDAVTAELQALISRESIPGGTLLLSHIREAISIAAGETNYVMTTPSADVTSSTGYITTLGTITWV